MLSALTAQWQTMAQDAILILGMHRSGTSCLAGSLQECGLHLGQVYESRPHNRKGNREHQRVMDLNNAVLACSGAAWDVPPDQLRWDDACTRARAATITELAHGANGGAWGFKDPRTLLTLPFWREVLEEVRMVGTFRDPLQVMRSLRARDPSMPPARCLDLWLAYNQRLLDLHAEAPFPLVDFDCDAADYAAAVDRMRLHLGLPDPQPGAARFFDEALRSRESAPDAPVPGRLARLHMALKEASSRWQ